MTNEGYLERRFQGNHCCQVPEKRSGRKSATLSMSLITNSQSKHFCAAEYFLSHEKNCHCHNRKMPHKQTGDFSKLTIDAFDPNCKFSDLPLVEEASDTQNLLKFIKTECEEYANSVFHKNINSLPPAVREVESMIHALSNCPHDWPRQELLPKEVNVSSPVNTPNSNPPGVPPYSKGYVGVVKSMLDDANDDKIETEQNKGHGNSFLDDAFNGCEENIKKELSPNLDLNLRSTVGENTALHLAAMGGHTKCIKLLLEAGADPEMLNDQGHTPIMEAASNGHLGAVKELLPHFKPISLFLSTDQAISPTNEGSAVSLEDDSNASYIDLQESPLTLASYRGHAEIVKFLLQHKEELRITPEELHIALMEASMDAHVQVAEILIDNGAPIAMNHHRFETPLTLACSGGHLELVKLLVDRGADIECSNDEGYTPLMEASREGQYHIIKYLLSVGAKVNGTTEESMETALSLACINGWIEIVDFLIENGANMDMGCCPPFVEAAIDGHVNILQLLIDKGFEINSERRRRVVVQALSQACENGHLEVVKFILSLPALGVDDRCSEDRTPLMKACLHGQLSIAEYLISNGADVNATTRENEITPLSLALLAGNLEIVKYLLANGADANHALKDGVTMLMEAVKGGNMEVVSYLLEFPKSEPVSFQITEVHEREETLSELPKKRVIRPCKFNINAQSFNRGDSVLTIATSTGQVAMVRYLLAMGANVNHQDLKGYTPLMIAATFGYTNICQILIKNGADLEICTFDNRDTALSLSTAAGKASIVEMLLRFNANIEHRNANDYTPICTAAMHGYVDVLSVLLKFGADIESRRPDGSQKLTTTPLILSLMQKHDKMAQMLISNNADIHVKLEQSGATALNIACAQAMEDVVLALLKKNVDVENKSRSGHTPLMEAAFCGSVSVGKLLLSYGADVNAVIASTRSSILHLCAERNHHLFAHMLLSHKALPNLKNNKNQTAAHIASERGYIEMMDVLRQFNANLDIPGPNKCTPIQVAFRNGCYLLIKWFVKNTDCLLNEKECRRYINELTLGKADKDKIQQLKECLREAVDARKAKEMASQNSFHQLLCEIADENKSKQKNKSKNPSENNNANTSKLKTKHSSEPKIKTNSAILSTTKIKQNTEKSKKQKTKGPIIQGVHSLLSYENNNVDDRALEFERKSSQYHYNHDVVNMSDNSVSVNNKKKSKSHSSEIDVNYQSKASFERESTSEQSSKKSSDDDFDEEWYKVDKRGSFNLVKSEKTLTVQIPTAQISRIIGKSGNIINSIRKKYDCFIDVDTSRQSVSGFHPMRIRGHPENIRQASKTVNLLITDHEAAMQQLEEGLQNVSISSNPNSPLLDCNENVQNSPQNIPPFDYMFSNKPKKGLKTECNKKFNHHSDKQWNDKSFDSHSLNKVTQTDSFDGRERCSIKLKTVSNSNSNTSHVSIESRPRESRECIRPTHISTHSKAVVETVKILNSSSMPYDSLSSSSFTRNPIPTNTNSSNLQINLPDFGLFATNFAFNEYDLNQGSTSKTNAPVNPIGMERNIHLSKQKLEEDDFDEDSYQPLEASQYEEDRSRINNVKSSGLQDFGDGILNRTSYLGRSFDSTCLEKEPFAAHSQNEILTGIKPLASFSPERVYENISDLTFSSNQNSLQDQEGENDILAKIMLSLNMETFIPTLISHGITFRNLSRMSASELVIIGMSYEQAAVLLSESKKINQSLSCGYNTSNSENQESIRRDEFVEISQDVIHCSLSFIDHETEVEPHPFIIDYKPSNSNNNNNQFSQDSRRKYTETVNFSQSNFLQNFNHLSHKDQLSPFTLSNENGFSDENLIQSKNLTCLWESKYKTEISQNSFLQENVVSNETGMAGQETESFSTNYSSHS